MTTFLQNAALISLYILAICMMLTFVGFVLSLLGVGLLKLWVDWCFWRRRS